MSTLVIALWFIPGTPCNARFLQSVSAMAEGEEAFARYLAEPGPQVEAQEMACRLWEDAIALAGGVMAGSLVSIWLARGAIAASIVGGLAPGLLLMLLVWRSGDSWGAANRTILIGVIAWAASLGWLRIRRVRRARRTVRGAEA